MKNINQEHQNSSDPINPYQIFNNIPEKQAIILQNTNKDQPIQIRVDPVTDYTALWITISASILASLITAILTIMLVRQSNKILLSGQLKQQKILLESQANQFKQQLEHELNIKKMEFNKSNTIDIIKEIKNHLYILHTSLDNVAIFSCHHFRAKLGNRLYPKNELYSEEVQESCSTKITDLIDKIRFNAEQLRILLDLNSIESDVFKKTLDDSIKNMTKFFNEINEKYENGDLNSFDKLEIINLDSNYRYFKPFHISILSLKTDGMNVLKELTNQLLDKK